MSEQRDRTAVLQLLATSAAELVAEVERTPPTRALAAGERLRRRWDADLVAAAFAVADLRARATTKLGPAQTLWLTRSGLEQASGRAPASHRARQLARCLIPDAVVADLGCGVGGDTMALAREIGTGSSRGRVLAIDRDPVHAWCCRKNTELPGPAATVAAGDVRDLRLQALPHGAGAAALVLDPARRSGGRRTSPRDTQPALAWATGLAERVAAVVVKAAPGLPPDAVPSGWTVEFVAVGPDLKEAVLWSPATARAGAARSARLATILTCPLHLPPGPSEIATLVADPATPPASVGPPGSWLLDPNPAVTRARAVADLAAATGYHQIDPKVAFLSGEGALSTPFGRVFAVAASLPFHERRLREVLRGLDVGAVDIRRRGLAGDVETLRSRLQLRGRRRALLAMTRYQGRPWAVVGFRPQDQDAL